MNPLLAGLLGAETVALAVALYVIHAFAARARKDDQLLRALRASHDEVQDALMSVLRGEGMPAPTPPANTEWRR